MLRIADQQGAIASYLRKEGITLAGGVATAVVMNAADDDGAVLVSGDPSTTAEQIDIGQGPRRQFCREITVLDEVQPGRDGLTDRARRREVGILGRQVEQIRFRERVYHRQASRQLGGIGGDHREVGRRGPVLIFQRRLS